MKKRSMYPRRNSGFTLIEITLALAVLAVVTAIALPMVQSRMRDFDLKTARMNVYQHLIQTRTRAMDQGRSWTFVISVGDQQYRAFPTDAPKNQRRWNLENAITFSTPDSSDSNSAITKPIGPIYFHSDGTCSESQIVLCDQHGKKSTLLVSRLRGITIR